MTIIHFLCIVNFEISKILMGFNDISHQIWQALLTYTWNSYEKEAAIYETGLEERLKELMIEIEEAKQGEGAPVEGQTWTFMKLTKMLYYDIWDSAVLQVLSCHVLNYDIWDSAVF